MKSRWQDKDVKTFLKKFAFYGKDLALRTYTAQLIGQDPELVLHGGGNTSVKTLRPDVTGRLVHVLCVKGSGGDLATIQPAGHPAVRFHALQRLRSLPTLSDEAMVNEFRTQMLDSQGPTPSVETLLHAFLPHAYIDHTHANAILSLVDQPEAEPRLRDWADGRLGIVPYIMPGFALAKLAAEIYEKDPAVEGLLLLKHGIFTFGETAQQSYERMIHWVGRAEKRLNAARAVAFTARFKYPFPSAAQIAAAANIIRGEFRWEGKRRVVRHRQSPSILKFVNSREGALWSQSGPATPDHVIRTKPKPLMLPPVSLAEETTFRNVLQAKLNQFQRAYQTYVATQSRRKHVHTKPLDPLPRVILVPGAGVFAAAEDATAADIALDVYETTIGIIEKAHRVGRYQALGDGHLFDMEYWSLEQAKLGKAVEKPLGGKIVWISGAASGIGRATAEAFGAAGAHVFLTDRDGPLLKKATEALGLKKRAVSDVCDVTDARQVRRAFEACSLAYGGVDIVVSNAGVAPSGEIATCPDEVLRKSFEINFFAHQNVAQAAARIFRKQRLGGVLLFNASKSAFNPGPGFGPYTLPKAGVIALMRQYAVELGAEGVRCNAVNADRVRTSLYAKGLLEKRAKARGLTVGRYVSGNLLGEEVFAEDVAQAFVALAQAGKTTGAVLPVDGGNAAAFPR